MTSFQSVMKGWSKVTPARLRELEVFDAVLRCGSVTRAAELLGVSQPAISKLLRSLEIETDLRLFDRIHRRLTPTPEARRLHEEVVRLFASARRVTELAHEIRTSGHGELRVAALPILGLCFLPRLLAKLRVQHPGLKVSLSMESSKEVRETLLNRAADVGFTLPLADQAPLIHGWTILVPAVVVLPLRHRLAKTPRISPRDLDGENFISLGRTYRMRHLVDALFDGEKVSRHLEIETQNSSVACELAALGAGITVVDAVSAAEFNDRAAICPLEPTIEFQINALIQPALSPSMLVHKLMTLLEESLAGIGRIERMG
jgi:DNA-binding transcriptional LysR family regulator